MPPLRCAATRRREPPHALRPKPKPKPRASCLTPITHLHVASRALVAGGLALGELSEAVGRSLAAPSPLVEATAEEERALEEQRAELHAALRRDACDMGAHHGLARLYRARSAHRDLQRAAAMMLAYHVEPTTQQHQLIANA